MLYNSKNFPEWVIFLIDMAIVVTSVFLAYLIRFDFEIPNRELIPLPKIYAIILSIRAVSFYVGKTYASIIRYTSTRDAVRFTLTVLFGSIAFIFVNLITYQTSSVFLIPFSIIIIDFILTILAAIAYRIIVKIAYLELQNPTRLKSNVVIFGAGESGVITKRAIDRDAGSKMRVLAFIDEDDKKEGKKLEGVNIFTFAKLDTLVNNNDIAHLIISIQNIPSDKKQEIVDKCLEHGISVLNVPPVTKWINGVLSFKQIKEVKIEDLLERDPIKLDRQKNSEAYEDKTILISGAAGSIGSELVRQLAQLSHKRLVLIDIAETPSHELEMEMIDMPGIINFELIIADIRDREKLELIFRQYKPQVVFHAAAYKHVPMMENHPQEALKTNIGGTRILADLSVEYNVERFVMISTDKAVNPTSVMGASKRIAEIYTQSMDSHHPTKFITTRFGNVLGSSGSVIPLFRKQIQHGGPVTITHPEVTRFFMTIPEACQLVLEAGAFGKGGEIFIFDMGKSVKIIDLAKKMIRLSGLELGKDIQIIYKGLRPGEKLYEELLNTKENTLPTHHPLIMIAKVMEYNYQQAKNELDELEKISRRGSNFDIVRKMKALVPEYKSRNSIFEQLDREEKE